MSLIFSRFSSDTSSLVSERTFVTVVTFTYPPALMRNELPWAIFLISVPTHNPLAQAPDREHHFGLVEERKRYPRHLVFCESPCRYLPLRTRAGRPLHWWNLEGWGQEHPSQARMMQWGWMPWSGSCTPWSLSLPNIKRIISYLTI